MRVDEAWRDDAPHRVDRDVGGRIAEVADGGDAITADRDVGAIARGTGAVDHRAAPDQHLTAFEFLAVHHMCPACPHCVIPPLLYATFRKCPVKVLGFNRLSAFLASRQKP